MLHYSWTLRSVIQSVIIFPSVTVFEHQFHSSKPDERKKLENVFIRKRKKK